MSKILIERVLTKGNIYDYINEYNNALKNIKLPSFNDIPTIKFFKLLKRSKIEFPAYKNEISIFELANRVFSDLVILYGIKFFSLIIKKNINQLDLFLLKYQLLMKWKFFRMLI